jgi:hypothetical protein
MALTGWLARREREVVVYLIEKPLPALPAVGRAAQFLPAGGVIVASAENWHITPSRLSTSTPLSWGRNCHLPPNHTAFSDVIVQERRDHWGTFRASWSRHFPVFF